MMTVQRRERERETDGYRRSFRRINLVEGLFLSSVGIPVSVYECSGKLMFYDISMIGGRCTGHRKGV